MFLMRDEKEERKKQARSNKQTRQSNTAHPKQSLFLNELPRVGPIHACVIIFLLSDVLSPSPYAILCIEGVSTIENVAM